MGLQAYYSAHAPAIKPLRVSLANLEERLRTLTEKFPTMVMDEAEKPRETFILTRGDYLQPGETGIAGTPAVLPPPPEMHPTNRLGLAQWIVMPRAPTYGPRRRESNLASVLRCGHRPHDRRFRRSRRVAESSGIARLAGRRFHREPDGTRKRSSAGSSLRPLIDNRRQLTQSCWRA